MSLSSTTARRLAIVGVSVLSLIICCGLAWWQWERYSSAGGTFQNLGYVLQWPLFGLFPAFMFWRIRRLNRQAREAEQHGASEGHTPSSGRVEWGRRPADVPAPRPAARQAPPADDEDEELAAYNRYLAELNARDQEVT
ncbi:hypothetical protein [Prauserella flavalba]|uniref:DNA-binding transcriptional regulator of glucitol operon n=1 Tax=Prauserella flavalba TaxID=1477506 RepID=A0A318LWM7_9PSEU|nr:hypothetical protein [Prauserella flavalba]PXY30642.1 hypothetical protein BA062_19035 [Prauserella flavalba]